jgi:hypothetical protein
MMKKIRAYMGKAENATMLKGMVELDDGYFSTTTSNPVKQRLKRGKGSQRKSKVTVMAESFPLEIEGRNERYCGQFKMKVNSSEEKATASNVVRQGIDPGIVLFTYQSTGYVDLKNLLDVHVSFKSL